MKKCLTQKESKPTLQNFCEFCAFWCIGDNSALGNFGQNKIVCNNCLYKSASTNKFYFKMNRNYKSKHLCTYIKIHTKISN